MGLISTEEEEDCMLIPGCKLLLRIILFIVSLERLEEVEDCKLVRDSLISTEEEEECKWEGEGEGRESPETPEISFGSSL